jgi:hypothetical protein
MQSEAFAQSVAHDKAISPARQRVAAILPRLEVPAGETP